jgi:hypothetical protein
LEAADVDEVFDKLSWEAAVQSFKGYLAFWLADPGVLLALVEALATHPQEIAAEQVELDIAERLDVVAPRLLEAPHCADGCFSGGARQRLSLDLRNVRVRGSITVSLHEPEIDDIELVR